MSAVSVQNGLSKDLWRIIRADLKGAMLRPSIRIAVLFWILQIVVLLMVFRMSYTARRLMESGPKLLKLFGRASSCRCWVNM